MGLWLLAIVAVGTSVMVASGEVGALAGLVLWSVPGGYYGWRLVNLRVVADSDGVTVHNRFRTRRLGWSQIDHLAFEKRRGRWWDRLWLWDRWVGVVHLANSDAVEIDATETASAFPSGRFFFGSKQAAADGVERLIAVSPPGGA